MINACIVNNNNHNSRIDLNCQTIQQVQRLQILIIADNQPFDCTTFIGKLRLISQGTVDNNLGPDNLAGPKALDPNHCSQLTLCLHDLEVLTVHSTESCGQGIPSYAYYKCCASNIAAVATTFNVFGYDVAEKLMGKKKPRNLHYHNIKFLTDRWTYGQIFSFSVNPEKNSLKPSLQPIHYGKFENIHFVYQILPKRNLHQSVGYIMRN